MCFRFAFYQICFFHLCTFNTHFSQEPSPHYPCHLSQTWKEVVYSMVLFTCTMVVMFWVSLFLYSSFYFTYMPQETINFPVYFHYSSCGKEPGICSNPVSSVPIGDNIVRSKLMHGQKYQIVLDLEMPESPSNQHVGMFLVSAELKGEDGFKLHKISRSVMLRYKSPLLQNLSTMVFAPLLLYGACEEKQVLSTELFDKYEERQDAELMEVLLEVESRHVEIYSARLRIHAMYSGVRYLMYYYPIMSAIAGVGTSMFFLAIIVIFSWYQMSPEDDFSSKTRVGSSSTSRASEIKLPCTSKASSTSSPIKISGKGALEAGSSFESPGTGRSSDVDRSTLNIFKEGSTMQEVEKNETGESL
ncbi:lipid droplet biogenesis associated protein seipin isoform X2 [Oratosquilla oratoria]|uniref:lipid droplet biogenesis associated protein seipin isoform X2 n=1 Tax=Oratosquilla oratoria TaxID=337810 RepID=UPI003F773130